MINIGDKFGDLEILDNQRIKINNSYYMKVKCRCGKEYNVQVMSLKHGRVTKCKTCANFDKRRLKVEINEQYKEWTVIEQPISIGGQMKCKVKCSCGNTRMITLSQLKNPNAYFRCKQCNTKTLLNGFRNGILIKFKRNALSRGIEFSDDLTSEYLYNILLNQQFKCALTGDDLLPADNSLDHRQEELNLSLDRIDSNIGYIPGNVQWVTKQVNWSKSTLNNQEFINLCQRVINHANQQPSQENVNNSILEGSTTNE